MAEAALRSAEAQTKNSDSTLMRAAALYKDRFGTQVALDDAQAAGVKAHSAVDQVTAILAYENQQLVVIDANVGVAKARVDSAEATLLSAKFALADTAVWAPIDGIVANRKVRVGEYIASGTPMLSIVPIQNLWVKANYRETQIGRMKIGDPVRINIDTYPGRPSAAMSKRSCRPPGRNLLSFRRTTRPGISQRSSAGSWCASASIAATPTLLSPARACRWKPPSPSLLPTMPRRSSWGNRLAASSIQRRTIAQRTMTRLPEHPGLGRARPQGSSGTDIPARPEH